MARLPPLGFASPAAVICSFARYLILQAASSPLNADTINLVKNQSTGSYWQSVGLGATPAAFIPKTTYWMIHSAAAGTSTLAGTPKGDPPKYPESFNYLIYDHAALAGYNDDLVADQWTLSAARNLSIVGPMFGGFTAGCLVWFGQRLGLQYLAWLEQIEDLVDGCTKDFDNGILNLQPDRDGYVDHWAGFGDSFLIGLSLMSLALDLDLALPWKDVAAALG